MKELTKMQKLQIHLWQAEDGDEIPEWALDAIEALNDKLGGTYSGQVRNKSTAMMIYRDALKARIEL